MITTIYNLMLLWDRLFTFLQFWPFRYAQVIKYAYSHLKFLGMDDRVISMTE